MIGQPYPLYPLPLIKGKGNCCVREASPLFNSPLALTSSKGGGLILKGIFTPFSPLQPSPIGEEKVLTDRIRLSKSLLDSVSTHILQVLAKGHGISYRKRLGVIIKIDIDCSQISG